MGISGCATTPQDARDRMAGMSRAEVLACAGAPLREAQDGNIAVMTYARIRSFDADTVFRCEVSVTLRAGLVDAVRFSGQRNLCAAIVKDCRA